MKFTRTRIEPDIDLDAEGKHFGFLRIPHSVHRSAYGWLPMPVISIKNGDGPRILLMGGNHGDEYEGQIALCKLARSLEPEAMQGHLVVLPMANYPAARAGRRTSPIDEGNLNRSFPGDPDGTLTQMIAHLIEEELLTSVDVVFDLHSGGSSLMYLPSVQFALDADGTLPPLSRELAELYAAPFTHVIRSGDIQCSGAAQRKGVLRVGSEFGGAGTVTPEALRYCEQGLPRLLHRLGALKTLPAGVGAPDPTRFLEIRDDVHFVYASEDGVHEPLVELGDEVKANDPAGAIHFPETPWREPVVEHFEADGLVVCKRVPGRTERGDCLFHLAADWSP